MYSQLFKIFCVVVLFTYSVGEVRNLSRKDYVERIESPLPYETIGLNSLPDSWDWRNINGTDYCSPVRNQHQPQYCGSCYAHAITSMMNDRLNIQRGNKWPKPMLSPQYILNCAPLSDCVLGEPNTVLEFGAKTGFVHDSCQEYRAIDYIECNGMGTCYTCDNSFEYHACRVIPEGEFLRYKVREHGVFFYLDEGPTMEDKMKAEIYLRGPIVCEIATPPDFESLTLKNGTGVYRDTTGSRAYDHAISIVGYGIETTGEPYWTVRNSWGEFYADHGYVKVYRGENNIGIESLCWWATPENTS